MSVCVSVIPSIPMHSNDPFHFAPPPPPSRSKVHPAPSLPSTTAGPYPTRAHFSQTQCRPPSAAVSEYSVKPPQSTRHFFPTLAPLPPTRNVHPAFLFLFQTQDYHHPNFLFLQLGISLAARALGSDHPGRLQISGCHRLWCFSVRICQVGPVNARIPFATTFCKPIIFFTISKKNSDKRQPRAERGNTDEPPPPTITIYRATKVSCISSDC